ncbi:MAG TPA: 2-phospho-L-lactate transferase [Steroidobacteraceae bacterium]|nr:2-phospho-L-lactate transferase [Steroidobacteraceae bacterium]
MGRIVALCGGVGGAKLADGLQRCLAPGDLQLIVNTGDDFEHRGLPICPDLDTVLYTLAGVANAEQGWGRADESWQVQAEWRALGLDTWFQLGDRDIALHLHRREMQARGLTLTQISHALAREFGVPSALLPMCDQPAATLVLTDQGEMPFQEYFVQRRCEPAARGFRYGAATGGGLSAQARAALEDAQLDGIILCPSNPYLSIAPILAVPGLRDLLVRARVPVIAVSPIIGGAAVKGPAAKIMRELDLAVSPLEIAREYGDFLDLLLIDAVDAALLDVRLAGDPQLEAASILMRTVDERRMLAAVCLEILRRWRC